MQHTTTRGFCNVRGLFSRVCFPQGFPKTCFGGMKDDVAKGWHTDSVRIETLWRDTKHYNPPQNPHIIGESSSQHLMEKETNHWLFSVQAQYSTKREVLKNHQACSITSGSGSLFHPHQMVVPVPPSSAKHHAYALGAHLERLVNRC